MHADITRDTFRPNRNYVGVTMQQGRVQLDADVNERESIERHRRRQLADGIIGPFGVEKDSGAFEISVAPNGADILIGEGRLWIDGHLCENTPERVRGEVVAANSIALDRVDLDARLIGVDDWIEVSDGATDVSPVRVTAVNVNTATVVTAPALAGVAVGANVVVNRIVSLQSQPYRRGDVDLSTLSDGQYAVTFTAWDHEVTALDDEAILEVALNGSDTATRLQAAWRVEIARVGGVGAGDCETPIPNFPPTLDDGRLAAFVDAGTAQQSPCILPDAGGYRGLEHQLYRVEVHRVIGGEVVLKWQRDNANLASRVDAVGTTFRVDDIGRDEISGFQEVGFVELTDQRLMLSNLAGDLLKVNTINRATRQITIDTNFAGLHAETSVGRASDDFVPRARRWDGRVVANIGDATQTLPLERGLVVRIEGSSFSEGDYWLIPARTATIADPSSIEWPTTHDGVEIAVAPHGITHSHGRLGMVDINNGVAASGSEIDCRPEFPPLTDLDATDVGFDPGACGFGDEITTVQQAIDELCGRSGGTCSRTAVPGAGWETVFDGLPESAEICFPIGDFPLTDTVEIAGSGHLLVHGAGWGSSIEALTADSALIFVGWASVTVRDLAVQAGDGGARVRPNPNNGLRGALSFRECDDTVVERVRVRTAPRTVRATSALSVYGSSGSTPGSNRARIANCLLEVGDKQVGILGVDLGRFVVHDNVLTVVAATRVITGLRDLAATELKAVENLLFRGLTQSVRAIVDNPDEPATPRVPTTPGGSSIVGRRPVGPNSPSSRLAVTAAGLDDDARLQVRIAGAEFSFVAIPEAQDFWRERIGDQSFASMVEFQRFQSQASASIIASSDTSPAGVGLSGFLTNRVAARRIPVMSQGIVAGGSALGDVTVTNNHVGDVIRGIHLGTSHQDARTASPDEGDRFIVADNRVSVRIPSEGARGRHGIFCGNAGGVTIRGNEVTFASSAPEEFVASTGIRIFGFIDRFSNVRENQIEGFVNSVEVTALRERGSNQLNRTRLYQVRENVLVQSGLGVRVDGPFAGDVIVADNAGTP